MRRLGLLGLLPFVIPAIGVWMAPWALPMRFALELHQMALVYAGIIAAYLAGVGAGGLLLSRERTAEGVLPGMIAALVAWLAIWQGGPLVYVFGAAWRYAILVGVFVYLYARDRRAAAAGALPGWYGALRARLTFWATLSLVAIMSRLILWGYY